MCARTCEVLKSKIGTPAADLNNNTSLLDLTQKTTSAEDARDAACLHVFVFTSMHLHLNAKSICLRGLGCGLGGRLDDEQTLQGRIISYYPQFTLMCCAGERNWIRPRGRNERSHSLDLLDCPPLPAPCLPCLPASHPSFPSTARCFPYVLIPSKTGMKENVMTVALVNRIVTRKQWNKSKKCFLRNYASLMQGPRGRTRTSWRN